MLAYHGYLKVWGQSVKVREVRAFSVDLVSIDYEIIHANKQLKYKEDIN